MSGESHFLPHDHSHIHGGRAVGQEVEVGVVHRVGIRAEHSGIHRHVHLVEHFGQASAARATNDPVEIASPEVFAVTGDLQLPVHRNRSHQLEPQALESRIVGREFALGPHGTAPKVPDIHTQHSRLT